MNKQSSKAVYVISVAARLANVHPQTLRIYEREGILRPMRTPTNIRLYSEEDIERLRFIRRLTEEEGINLAGIKRILKLMEEMEDMRREMEVLRREIEKLTYTMKQEIEKVHRSYRKEIVKYTRGEIYKA